MRIAVLAVGRELFSRLESNSVFIEDAVSRMGHGVRLKAVCDDDVDDICHSLRFISGRSDLVIVTGGLGPTEDDLSRHAAAALLGVELVFNEDSWQDILQRFAAFERPCTQNNRRQALFPEGAQILPNDLGTADAFSVQYEGVKIFFLPGVPKEMKALYHRFIAPELAAETDLHSLEWHYSGPGESVLDLAIQQQVASHMEKDFTWNICAHYGFYRIIITGTALQCRRITRLMHAVCPEYRISSRGLDPRAMLVRLASRKGLRLAAAESCTGGLLSSLITDVPGASACFQGSLICYSNSIKQSMLGVPAGLIERFGAVSEEVAGAMAAGAADVLSASVVCAISGIAGPGGGTPEKPVGTVCFAVQAPGALSSGTRVFSGNRDDIRQAAAWYAMRLMLDAVRALEA